MIFLNHAGVSPISPPAARAMQQYIEQVQKSVYVGSGWYKRAGEIKTAAARLIGAASGDEISFIPNTSTGLNIVARGLPWQEGDNVVITGVEFPANRYPWEDLKRLGVQLREVRQQEDGRIDVEDVIDAINDKTRVVSVSHVQYASGHRLALRDIADVVHSVPGDRGLLCVDGIQSVGAMPVDVRAMGVDFLSADSHKWMLGPEGCGFFYCRADLIEILHPPIVGWMNMVDANNYGDYRFELETTGRRFEPGGYNFAGILGMGASIDMLLDIGLDKVWAQIDALTSRLCEGLASKGYRVFTPRTDPDERSGIVIFEADDPKRVAGQLEKQGIFLVMREGRLRASPHFHNTLEQMDRVVDAL